MTHVSRAHVLWQRQSVHILGLAGARRVDQIERTEECRKIWASPRLLRLLIACDAMLDCGATMSVLVWKQSIMVEHVSPSYPDIL